MICFVSVKYNVETRYDIYCSCYNFCKQKQCEHISFVLCSLKCKARICLIPIGIKKGVGRPRKEEESNKATLKYYADKKKKK